MRNWFEIFLSKPSLFFFHPSFNTDQSFSLIKKGYNLLATRPQFTIAHVSNFNVYMHALMQKYDKDENIPELEITELKSIEYAAIIWKIDVVEAGVLFTR